MVVINDNQGYLANRIFFFGIFIANALEYKYTLYNPNFEEYKDYFPVVYENDFLGLPIKIRLSESSLLHKFYHDNLYRIKYRLPQIYKNQDFVNTINILSYYETEENYDLNQADYVQKAQKLLFIEGWHYRDVQNFTKYADTIRKIFKPEQKYIDNVNTLITKKREDCDVLVGVHLRKGDYKTFLDGKYYFELEQYAEFMLQIHQELENQKVRFLLCSNEKIVTEFFTEKGLDVCLSTNHALEDMYSLAACDYIFGPPSTYSMWASFYGKTPLRILDKKGIQMSLKDFSPIKSIDHFENGKVFKHILE